VKEEFLKWWSEGGQLDAEFRDWLSKAIHDAFEQEMHSEISRARKLALEYKDIKKELESEKFIDEIIARIKRKQL